MRILYGVQATGNGHITRARVMAPALAEAGLEVDYLFSGRAPEQLFNMEPFGNYQCRRGLTFFMQGSRVDHWKTLKNIKPIQLLKDINALDVSGYDLVITDFEPITAWAARRQGVKSIGIAHQYAFLHDLPGDKASWMLKQQVRYFAPVDLPIGLHWHHFYQAIFPPLIQPAWPREGGVIQGKVVVYLPHNNYRELIALLKLCSQGQFYIYAPIAEPIEDANCHVRPFSRTGFQQDLAESEGVICNSGFGLLSEALQSGKKIMTLPQKGQVEQESNAEVLTRLELGEVIQHLDGEAITHWLQQSSTKTLEIPDLAGLLAAWIASGCKQSVKSLARESWGY